jgi:hemolysin-activating ACP:hemolysin acyltransferase
MENHLLSECIHTLSERERGYRRIYFFNIIASLGIAKKVVIQTKYALKKRERKMGGGGGEGETIVIDDEITSSTW